MLAGDKALVTVIRGIKSTILNAEISSGSRDEGLSDSDIISLLQKEAKKRADAIDLYEKAGETDRAAQEKYEKSIIEGYLPEQLSDDAVRKIIDAHLARIDGDFDRSKMGQIIGAVKAETAGTVDGATIARLVQEKIQ